MLNCIFVGIGGFVGSVLRYLAGLIPVEPSNGFPVKTLVINILGSFLLGLIAAAAAKNINLDPKVVLMLKVGVCGGFTTFSTFAYEAQCLMQSGHTWLALAYVLLSIILGVAAIFLAQAIIH